MKKLLKCLIIPCAFAILSITTPAQAEVTMAKCEADYNSMLAEAEQNRVKSVAQIEFALGRETNDEAAARLQEELEKTFEMEEQFRNLASVGYRDCVRHVKSKG
jgi:hypothetical protein